MDITKKDVELAGKLAHMHISEEESSLYEEQLKALFNWVQELSAVNTDGVTLTQTDLAAYVRSDVPVENEALARELRNDFAAQENACAKVKKVL